MASKTPNRFSPEVRTRVSFGMGSERRSARQLVELSNRGGVKL